MTVYSGLGHGVWIDSVLSGVRGGKKVHWRASGAGWVVQGREVEWVGVRKPRDGALWCEQLADDCCESKLLALYLPRGSKPKAGGEPVRGKGEGMGMLGVLLDDLDDDMVQHMVLTCVSIEEQIMRSRGFGGAYHGAWGY